MREHSGIRYVANFKSLIPTFDRPSKPKVGIKLLKLATVSHARMFSHPKILFLVLLLFVALLNSIATYLLNF